MSHQEVDSFMKLLTMAMLLSFILMNGQ